MDDTDKNIEEYNPNKKCKMLNVFGDTITDMVSNKKVSPTVTEFFIRGRKLNISLACVITQSYFAVPKNMTINSTHYFIMKIPKKWEPKHIALNHSSGIDFKDFMNFYRNCTAKPYSFLVFNATLASDNPSHFRTNILEGI